MLNLKIELILMTAIMKAKKLKLKNKKSIKLNLNLNLTLNLVYQKEHTQYQILINYRTFMQ